MKRKLDCRLRNILLSEVKLIGKETWALKYVLDLFGNAFRNDTCEEVKWIVPRENSIVLQV